MPKSIPLSLQERYEMLSFVGAGANGAVFKVRDKILDNVVALKILSRNATEDQILRFQQEAKATSKLNHPNIVSIFNFGTADEGDVYMVIEFIEGKTLADFIKLKFEFDEEQYLDIFSQLAEGMAHAHKHNILHRDLKPGNIIISEDENQNTKVTIIDFGIAKVLSLGVQLTTGKIAIGTPAYMSPEQGRAEEVDKRSDIYSFGCIAYEVLTGRKPFIGENAMEVLYKHSQEEVPTFEEDKCDLAREFVKSLRDLINKCLEKEKNRRFKDFTEIQEHLENIESPSKTSVKSGLSDPIQEEEQKKESLLAAFSEIERSKLNSQKFYLAILYSVLGIFVVLAIFFWKNFALLEKPIPPLVNDKEQNEPLSVTSKSKKNSAMDYFSDIPKLPLELRNADNKRLSYVANMRHQKLNYAAEIAVLNELLKRKPDDKEFLEKRAKALLELTFDKKAIKDIEKLIEMDPQNVNYKVLKAYCITRSQTTGQAIETYGRFIEKYPTEISLRRGRLRLLYDQKQYPLVIKESSKILELDDRDYTSRKMRGRSYSYLGEYDKAIEDFSFLINTGESKHYELRHHRAEAYNEKKEFKKALADLRFIIEGPDRSGTASYNLALKKRIKIYESIGEKKKAEKDRKLLYSGN